MRILALWLFLAPPLPVTSIGAVINSNGSITLSWTLPVDPNVVGVTIIRDRLDFFESNPVFTLVGAPVTFTDGTALVHASYRYWVYTRNAAGELSVGAFIDVVGANSPILISGSSSAWFCIAAASGGACPESLLLPAALLGILLIRIGRRSGRSA